MGIVLPASYSNGKQCTKANRVDNCKNSINLDASKYQREITHELTPSNLKSGLNAFNLSFTKITDIFFISLFAVGIQK